MAKITDARLKEEISYYKKKAIQNIIKIHPKSFKPVLEFDDWASAMKFLEAHKPIAAEFLARSKDD